MKYVSLLIVVNLISIIESMTTGPVFAETVRLTNGEWPPFTSEKEIKYHGVLSRIVTEAFALGGVKVEYGFYPWKRSLMYADSGKWDGSIGWAQGREDLTRDFLFTNPILKTSKALFSLKESPVKWDTIENLRGREIGVTASYFYGDAFEQAKHAGVFTFEEVTIDKQNIKKLLAGRFDAFAMEVDTALYLMRTALSSEEANRIMYDTHMLDETSLCVIFPKKLEKSARYVEIFNQGLWRLKESGRYDQYITESRQGLYNIMK